VWLARCAARDGWGDRTVLTVSRRNPGSSTRASSSLRKQTVGSSPTIGIFPYVAQARHSTHKRQTSMPPVGIRTHNLSRRGFVVRPAMLVRVPLSAYFFMYPYDWKYLLNGTVQRASMMGVLGTQGGFALALFQGWGGGVKYCWKMCSSNFSFWNKFIIFLSCGLLVDNTF
jgi:hypothetical protein